MDAPSFYQAVASFAGRTGFNMTRRKAHLIETEAVLPGVLKAAAGAFAGATVVSLVPCQICMRGHAPVNRDPRRARGRPTARGVFVAPCWHESRCLTSVAHLNGMPAMIAAGGEAVGKGREHHRGQRAARREAGDVHAARVDCRASRSLVDHLR